MHVKQKNKIAFLDRDGVINHDFGYVHKEEDLVFLSGVEVGLLELQRRNYRLFIVTNQSGIGRGYYTDSAFHEFMKIILTRLKSCGVQVEGYEYCPHHQDAIISKYRMSCNCRKPGAEMIKRILLSENVSPQDCIMIGDKMSDINAGIKAGIKQNYLIGGMQKKEVDISFEHVNDWFQLIENLNCKNH